MRSQRTPSNAVRMGLRHWRVLYGAAPPSPEKTNAADQAALVGNNQRPHQHANSAPGTEPSQVTLAKFGAHSRLLPHLLPGEPELTTSSQGASR